MFLSQLQWIADKKDSLNIPFVIHVGGIVDFDNIEHYEKASDGFNILDEAQIPYAVCLGNHDTEAVGELTGSAVPGGNAHIDVRKSTKFNSYFSVSRFPAQKGRYEEGKSGNSFYTFNAGYGDLSPSTIYNQIIKTQANVLFVLCWNIGVNTWCTDISSSYGKTYAVVSDKSGDFAGAAWIRLLDIDPAAGKISGKLYSPYYKTTKQDGFMFNISNVSPYDYKMILKNNNL